MKTVTLSTDTESKTAEKSVTGKLEITWTLDNLSSLILDPFHS